MLDLCDIDKYLIYARSLLFAKRINLAKETIGESLNFVKNPYVAFSCGKDSSVLAHLVIQENPRIPLRFLSSGETRIIHNVDEVMDWFRSQGATVEEILIDRVFSEEWKDASWTEQRKAGKHDLESLNEGNWDGIFMGLRMQESKHRKISLLKCQTPGRPRFCYQYKNGRARICPLATWTVEDVAAYLITRGIPVLQRYKDHGFEARTTARLTGDAVRQNVLTEIKHKNPEGWERLVARFPEFSCFV